MGKRNASQDEFSIAIISNILFNGKLRIMVWQESTDTTKQPNLVAAYPTIELTDGAKENTLDCPGDVVHLLFRRSSPQSSGNPEGHYWTLSKKSYWRQVEGTIHPVPFNASSPPAKMIGKAATKELIRKAVSDTTAVKQKQTAITIIDSDSSDSASDTTKVRQSDAPTDSDSVAASVNSTSSDTATATAEMSGGESSVQTGQSQACRSSARLAAKRPARSHSTHSV